MGMTDFDTGTVYVTLSAWGHEGPWRSRRGYDTVVQSANGMAYRPNKERPVFCRCPRRLTSQGICSRLARWLRWDGALAKARAGSCGRRLQGRALHRAIGRKYPARRRTGLH
jgi:hypothetical protein